MSHRGAFNKFGLKAKRHKAFTPIATIQKLDMNDAFNAHAFDTKASTTLPVCATLVSEALPSHVDRPSALKDVGLDTRNIKLPLEQFEQLSTLLYQYKDLFATDISELPCSTLEPHKIELTSETPVRQRQFRQMPVLERELQRQVDQLVEAGVVQESTSPFNSPAFLIKKPSGQFRLILDFRILNKNIKETFHPLPALDRTLSEISQESPNYFSILDLKMGFYQQPLAPESRKYTSFNTASGHYEFLRTPLGLSSSPTAFMSALSRLLHQELYSTVVCYIDDLLA